MVRTDTTDGNSSNTTTGRPVGSTTATVDGPPADFTPPGTDPDPDPGGFFETPGPGPGPSDASGSSGSSGSSDPGKGRGPGGWNRGKRKVNGRWVDPPSGPSSAGPSSSPKPGPPKPAKNPATLEGIEGILLSIHMMVASFSRIAELELAPDEAAKLAAAIARVAALYDVGASEKTLAWTNLIVCMGGIYGTRGFAYKLRKDSEAAEEAKKKPTPTLIFPGQYPGQAQGANAL